MARTRLPPLNALKSFEAAARLGSFTRAAGELGVTHGAVSRQVRLLEDWLDTPLFLRTGRNAVATRAGMELLAEIGPLFDRLAAATQHLRNRAPPSGPLHLSVLPTFAMRWLIPRLPEFEREHPGLELRIVTASIPAEQFRMDVDVVISGPSRQPGWVGTRFLGQARLTDLSLALLRQIPLRGSHDLVFSVPSLQPCWVGTRFLGEARLPVLSPALLLQIPLRRLHDLVHHTLLHAATSPQAWPRWLAAAGVPDLKPVREQIFEHFYFAIQ